MMEESKLKKAWYKSKTIWLNISNTVSGGLGLMAVEFNNLISSNLDWIKSSGVDIKYIYALLLVNGLLGIYLRLTMKDEIKK